MRSLRPSTAACTPLKVFSWFRCYGTTGSSRPLSIFVCAADEPSDSAGAALVASLKQLLGKPVHLYGVGGPLLQAQGLQSIVSDEQYQHLATAEVVQQAYSLHKVHGVSTPSKSTYLKIFRDVIWEAALQGCSSRSKPQPNQQQQQQWQQWRSSRNNDGAAVPQDTTYDAVLAIGSPMANQQLLFALRRAEEARVARLPAIVQYMVPGLWDPRQMRSAAATWSTLADHVMCSHPFEPALLRAAGGIASFVGSPAVELLLKQGTFGSRQQQVVQLQQQQQLTAQQSLAAAGSRGINSSSVSSAPVHSSSSRGRGGGSKCHMYGKRGSDGKAAGTSGNASLGQLFTVGNAAAFWNVFDRLHLAQRGRNADSNSSSNSSSSARPSSTAADAEVGRQARCSARSTSHRQVLCLLPGSTEAEVRTSMPVFDSITQQLLQQYPELVAAMLLPSVLVEAGIQATNNFAMPVLVAPAGSVLGTNALAAAAVALSHPGPESLKAAAAGVPMVCVSDGPMLRHILGSWRTKDQGPCSSLPNLILGHRVVPEFIWWSRGSKQAAVDTLARLLLTSDKATATQVFDGAVAGSSSSSSNSEWQAQRIALQNVLLALVSSQQVGSTIAKPVPSAASQQTSSCNSSAGVAALKACTTSKSSLAAGHAGDTGGVVPTMQVQAPSEAAAGMLLQLIELRKQQEATALQLQQSAVQDGDASLAV